MKRYLFAALCCLALPAFAELKLPALSPSAKVVQTIGLTDITIDYSSPAVKGRKIWGGVVPMDQVWRAGANHSTNITFSAPVVVGEKTLAAGTYSYFVIPGAKSWTLVLNELHDQWGSGDYNKEKDVVRITVTPQAIPNRERLVYLITNFTNDSANIDLEWEKVRVTLPVKLKTVEQASANIKTAAETAWQPMNQAARYYLESKDYGNGLAAVDKSIATQETWFNTWVKAQLLAGSGKYKDAYPLAEKAQMLGAKVPAGQFFYADEIKKALTEWKGK
jgi:Protein of unknown function (DUF2911)